jgi:diguanylate cyclase (GGDEF)-like protein
VSRAWSIRFSQMSNVVAHWKFLLFTIFTLTVASKMSVKIPRIDVVLTFSDAMIFLAFLIFGGPEAIVVSAVEVIITCFVLKRQGHPFSKLAIPFNIASVVVATSASFLCLTAIFGNVQNSLSANDTTGLIAVLGILAVSQFIISATLASAFQSLKDNSDFLTTWKKSGFTASVTQITGASVAGIAYKVINYGDYFSTSVAVLVLIVAYFSFRKIMSDMTTSIEEAETAQREKAAIEKLRAEQAELHAGELGVALAEQQRISEQLRETNDALEYAAYYDSLTKLPNRAYLIERLSLLFELGIDISNKYFVLFIDLKRFKNINNRLGHAIGDKVLALVAKRLLRVVKLEDTVARLGGDEFAIILNDLKSKEDAIRYARKIHQKLVQPFSLNGHKVFLGVNIGISPFDPEHQKPEDILRDADIAMHHSKERETEFAVFDKELRSKILETIKLESHLRFALEKNELSMHYQPLVSLEDGSIIGFEALLRWYHPTLGFVSPAQFIPIAEDSGLIIPITEWILKETTTQISKWQQVAPKYSQLMVSVNISGKHIAQDGLVESVREALEISRIDPSTLKLEITESTAMEDAERTVEILTDLKGLGAQLSIDDFGTGYSSLSHLHRLPFDTLKIDRSFVYKVGENGEHGEILQTILSLAKNLRMKVIAEGIETEAQLRLLRNLGCDFGQGYLMSKPLPKDEMEKMLYKKTLWFPQTFVDEEFGVNESDYPLQRLDSEVSQ